MLCGVVGYTKRECLNYLQQGFDDNMWKTSEKLNSLNCDYSIGLSRWTQQSDRTVICQVDLPQSED